MKLNIAQWSTVPVIVVALLILSMLLGTTAVALYRGPKPLERPRHFYILLALYCFSFLFVIFVFISNNGYWEEKEIYCEIIERGRLTSEHIAEALIVTIYYLRLQVFFGTNGFYNDWVRYGCWFLISWPLTVGLTYISVRVKVRITEKRCETFSHDNWGALWGGLLVPSSCFLLLFALPIRSSTLHPWKQSIKKQIWITLLATVNDIIFAILLACVQDIETFNKCFHMVMAALLSTFIFSDWRQRLQPFKYSKHDHVLQRTQHGRSSESLTVPLVFVDEDYWLIWRHFENFVLFTKISCLWC